VRGADTIAAERYRADLDGFQEAAPPIKKRRRDKRKY
jgi:hypothetical protein